MTREEFLKETKGKKIWWGSYCDFLNLNIDSHPEYLIVKDIDEDGYIIPGEGSTYQTNNRWHMSNGLFRSSIDDVNEPRWFILDGSFLDKIVLDEYNASLKKIQYLFEENKVTISDDGSLTLKEETN